MLDVVFDVSFMSGTSLEDRCSAFRGSTVPVHAVLNVTDRQLVVGSKAAAQHRPQPVAQSLTMNGYGVPTGPNGQGQFNPAQAPPPLQGSFREAVTARRNGPRGRGDARGRGIGDNAMSNGLSQKLPIRSPGPAMASGNQGGRNQMNGTVNHSRGNAAAQQVTRGGYTKIDISGADKGVIKNNPSFQPQPHTHVPPPASLDTAGRGRARGSFRGRPLRGDGYRGRGTPRGRGTQTVTRSKSP